MPAQAAALAALDDNQHIQRSVELNNTGMQQLCAGFDQLGLAHIPSIGNFVTVDVARDAAPVYQALLSEGVIVRPLGAYKMPQHLRVTIGTREHNERLLQAVKKVLS